MSSHGPCEFITDSYAECGRTPAPHRFLVAHGSDLGVTLGPQFFSACPEHVDELPTALRHAGFIVLDGPL